MWITGDVELPEEILDAQKRGELVFFVGAGASVAKPSGLPSFDSLARKLASKAGHKFSRRGGLDYFIGKLESLPQGFDAHYHAQKIIGDPKSKFNSIHSTVVDLASIQSGFRVVTTNYDDHLAAAAKAASIEIADTWYGPSLPLGRKFEGLVHLHGSVNHSSAEMILSDRDFGEAYITDAWATRFLLPMFERFTVVFIGYSHDDVIMRYLALGLPSDRYKGKSKRFAFTGSPLDSKWEHLGIETIGYPVNGHDHTALNRALLAWGTMAKMGRTEHESKIKDIVGGGPIMPWSDREYLLGRLGTKEGVQHFRAATNPLEDEAKLDWVMWLENSVEFQLLFSNSEVSSATTELAEWFVSNFILSPELNGAALQVMQRQGQAMTNSMYQIAVQLVGGLSELNPEAGERWQSFLATSVLGQSAPLGTKIIESLMDTAAPSSLSVLRPALRPFLKLEPRWFQKNSEERTLYPEAEISWNAGEELLSKYIGDIIESSVPGEHSLGNALSEAISSAYNLLDSYYGMQNRDFLTHQRAAIENHPQNSFREPLDAIIDGLREFGTKALEFQPDLPDRWWESGRPLMQRLALHLVAVESLRTTDSKLSWLLGRTDLYEITLKHEIYQVLAVAIGSASPSLKHRVLQSTAMGPDYSEDTPDRSRHIAYAKFNLLSWLSRHDTKWFEVRESLNVIQEEHPDFKTREYPDLNSWLTSLDDSKKPDLDVVEFLNSFSRDPQNTVAKLFCTVHGECDMDTCYLSSSLALVRQVADENPHKGLMLWDLIIHKSDINSQKNPLLRAIVEGWKDADLGLLGVEVVERLQCLTLDKDFASNIGQFLIGQIRLLEDSGESPCIDSMRNLAGDLWRKQHADFTYNPESDLFAGAALFLNSWPGWLAQYWIKEISRRWKASGEEWAGFSAEESSALNDFLMGDGPAANAAQPAVTGQLYFLFCADSNFTESQILPIFDDPNRHLFAWVPFLQRVRWDDRLLEAGLLRSLTTELSRIGEVEDDRLRGNFFQMIISVLSFSGTKSSGRLSLRNETVIASDGMHKVDFAKNVGRFLRDERVDGAVIWRKWLRRHVQNRLEGMPRLTSSEELACWADVVPSLGVCVPSAVECFHKSGMVLSNEYYSTEFDEGTLKKYSSELVAFYVERVENSPEADRQLRLRVRRLISSFRDVVDESRVRPLLVAAKSRGFVEEIA